MTLDDPAADGAVPVVDRELDSFGPPGFASTFEQASPVRLAPGAGLRAWVPLIAGVCVLAGVLAIRLGVLTGAGPSKAKQEAGLVGDWDVTGVVLQAHDDAAQTPGETLHRLWRIDKTCASQTCTLRLTRQVAGSTSQTIGGTLSAQLHWSAGHWLATFIQPYVVCDGDTTGQGGVEISTWTINLTRSGTITALEHTDTQGASCVPATSEIEWNAHRLAAPQSSNA